MTAFLAALTLLTAPLSVPPHSDLDRDAPPLRADASGRYRPERKVPRGAVVGRPPLAPPQASDVKLVGPVLRRFLKSKGRTLSGRQVVWNVPASVFDQALRRRRDHALFVHKGIGIVVSVHEPALARLRRRGGVARLRGRVHPRPHRPDPSPSPAPKKGKQKPLPDHFIAVRSLKARRR